MKKALQNLLPTTPISPYHQSEETKTCYHISIPKFIHLPHVCILIIFSNQSQSNLCLYQFIITSQTIHVADSSYHIIHHAYFQTHPHPIHFRQLFCFNQFHLSHPLSKTQPQCNCAVAFSFFCRHVYHHFLHSGRIVPMDIGLSFYSILFIYIYNFIFQFCFKC